VWVWTHPGPLCRVQPYCVKRKVPELCGSERTQGLRAGRMECTMQNIADYMTDRLVVLCVISRCVGCSVFLHDGQVGGPVRFISVCGVQCILYKMQHKKDGAYACNTKKLVTQKRWGICPRGHSGLTRLPSFRVNRNRSSPRLDLPFLVKMYQNSSFGSPQPLHHLGTWKVFWKAVWES